MALKNIVSDFSSIYRYFSGPRQGLRILMYHSVSNGVDDDPQNFFTVNPELFEFHIKILSEIPSNIFNIQYSLHIDSMNYTKIKNFDTFIEDIT